MSIPYRVRKALRNLGVFLLVAALVAGGALLTWLVWLNRFVIYTPGGAQLDFDLPDTFPSGQLAQPRQRRKLWMWNMGRVWRPLTPRIPPSGVHSPALG